MHVVDSLNNYIPLSHGQQEQDQDKYYIRRHKIPVEYNMRLIESEQFMGDNLLSSLSPFNVNLLFQLNHLKLMSSHLCCEAAAENP